MADDAFNPTCPHCKALLPPGARRCPACHRLVYEARLTELFQEAHRLESIDPILAANVWRQALSLLPPESVEFQQIAARINAISAAVFQQDPQFAAMNTPRPPPRDDPWPRAILKTGGSMILSMIVYTYLFKGLWQFAVGFVLLILIHELGHTLANWYYGIKQSPPVFVPFVGAIIVLRQNPPDAKAEAVIGIAGPIAGTFGALCCYLLFLYTRQDILLLLAIWTFRMNLFNMIPIWPLDGGRVAAGITPALWVAGAGIFAWVMLRVNGGSMMSLLIAFWIFQSTLPRIRDVVFRGGMKRPYYQIGANSRAAILVSYVLLTTLLLAMSDLGIVMKWFPVLKALVMRR